MDTKEWLPYFPELTGADELGNLIESVSGWAGPRPELRVGWGGVADEAAADQMWTLISRHNSEQWPFARFAVDLVPGLLWQFVTVLEQHPAFADGEEYLYGVLAPLLGALQDHLIRTLVTELHAYRSQGALTGSTPESRFASFVEQIAESTYQKSFRERYPVLLADLERISAQRLEHVREILDAVDLDRAQLEDVCAVRPGDRVVSITAGSGDQHRRGRSVAVVAFASGACAVYKPRSLQIDLRFSALVSRLNEQLDLGLRTPRAVTHDSYGWMEFIEYAPPAGRLESENYYRRVGHLTALLYALNTCDIHHENIICHRGSPVLIDLETMFHPVLAESGSPDWSAEAKIAYRVSRSVFAIGILPTVIGVGENRADIGGVGFEDQQRTPFKGFSFVGYGRDDMRISFEHNKLKSTSRVPQISSVGIEPARVAELVQDGFTVVTDWIIANREEFARLVAELFAGTEIRYLHNPTVFYGQILRMATHPWLLADPGRRHTLLHRVALRRRGSPAAIPAAELRDLEGGDIPYFTARVDETLLYDSFGAPLGDVLDKAPLRSALTKIENFDAVERDAQLALIAMSFVNKFPPESDRTGFTWPSAAMPSDDRTERLTEAIRIGDSLLRDMVSTDLARTTPNWLTAQVSSSEEQLWQPGSLGYDVYGGVTGVAYFLAMLSVVSGHDRFGDAALEVFTPLAGLLADRELASSSHSSGAFMGTAGIVYALDRAGRALGSKGLIAAAATGLYGLEDIVQQDTLLDVVGGAAGVLAVALALHETADGADRRERALAVATAAWRHLAGNYPALIGDALADAAEADTVFSGFAHGVSGLLPYLARLARITGDPAPRQAVAKLLTALDALRDPSGTDWFTSTLRTQRSYAWCHGAPGILLGLCLLEQEASGHDLGARIAAARDRTLERGFGNNATLCHGDFGNLELLRLCAKVTSDSSLADRCRAADSALLRTYIGGFRSRTDCKHLYTNSLLIGTSGIGFALLRSLDDDERVPPLLWLG